jgi:hypothetical protein
MTGQITVKKGTTPTTPVADYVKGFFNANGVWSSVDENGDIIEYVAQSTPLIVEVFNDPSVVAVNADAGTILINKTLGRSWIKQTSGTNTDVKPFHLSDLMTAHGANGWCSTSGITLTKTTTTNPDDTLRLILPEAKKIMHLGKEINLAAGNYDKVIDGAEGVRYVYFSGTTLTVSTSLTPFITAVPVAFLNWTGTSIETLDWELHTADRNIPDHYWKHTTIGTRYSNGLAITTNVQSDTNSDPATETCQYIYLTGGELLDEDIRISIGTTPWGDVILGSGLTSVNAGSFPLYFYDGIRFKRVAPTSDRTPFLSSPTAPNYFSTNGTPCYENSGVITQAVTGDYIVYWVFGSSLMGVDTIFLRPHIAKYSSLSLAQAANEKELIWAGFPSAEVKSLYRLIFRVNTGWIPTPAHGCKLVEAFDFRAVSTAGSSAISATSHPALSGRDLPNQHPAESITVVPSGGISATNVGAALTELDTEKLNAAEKGAASGVCPLNASTKIDSTYLPSYVDDVEEYANISAFPVTGEAGKIYVALDTNLVYRWSGSVYVEVSPTPSATSIVGFDEAVDDRVSSLIQNSTNITWSYNDTLNTFTASLANLTGFTTTNLSEGTNLYYTQARFDTAFGAKTTTNLAEGTNLYFTDERAQDAINAMLAAGAGISLSYNDAGNTFTISSTITQYTDEMARDAVAAALVSGAGISITNNDGADTITIANTKVFGDSYGASLFNGLSYTNTTATPTSTIGGAITTATLPIGTYRLGVFFTYVTTTTDVYVKVVLDGVDLSPLFKFRISALTGRRVWIYGFFNPVFATSTTHTIDVQGYVDVGGTLSIYDVQLEYWRVS